MVPAKSNLHPSGPVFTVELGKDELGKDDVIKVTEVHEGQVDKGPNHQSFDLSVIAFKDNGTLVDESQLVAAARCIDKARKKPNINGALVIVFIHGWHHGASWDDSHFCGFREILTSLALREAERNSFDNKNPLGRRVVGIYLGWNGDPAHWRGARYPCLTELSFWSRYWTAKRIGGAEHIGNVIRTIVARTKDSVNMPSTQSEPLPESPLIFIGHSLGALMLESAFKALLRRKEQPLVRKPRTASCVEIEKDGELVSFPDLILALNSAADSKIAKTIRNLLKKQGIKKTIKAPGDIGICYSPPLFISLTSTADWVTGKLWPWSHLRLRKTDGHDECLFTHTFLEEGGVSCPQKEERTDFGQNWHCLRYSNPKEKKTPSFMIDLPIRERKGIKDTPEFVRYELAPKVRITPRRFLRLLPARPQDSDPAHLAWIFQVSDKVIADHNDIFNSRCRELMIAMVQISGAIMNLAEDFEQNFDKDESKITPSTAGGPRPGCGL